MIFRTLAFILLVVTQVSFAQGRKPAVEDFVGIEVEQATHTPQGTEGLFNFEKDMESYQKTKTNTKSPVQNAVAFKPQGPSSLTTSLAVAFILGLPALICFLMMSHLRNKAEVESASNIEVLEKYRQERIASKKAQEDYKKAS